MFITHKNNVVQNIADLEWMCRMAEKGMSSSEYWTWEETIKDSDGVPDYSGESGYTIVECMDENVHERLNQLDDYIGRKPEGRTYNIKYYASKKDAEEIKDVDGNSYDPKQYVQSHFVGDDTAKDARLLADKWENVRNQRNNKLAETDYLALNDNTLSADMETYRSKLRLVPQDNSDPDNITWPTKPE